MSSHRGYPTEEMQKENDSLVEGYLAQDDLSMEEYIEKHASQGFKNYLATSKDEYERERAMYCGV